MPATTAQPAQTWINVREAQKRLSVSRNIILRYIERGVVTSRQLPEIRRTQILLADVIRIADEATRPAVASQSA